MSADTDAAKVSWAFVRNAELLSQPWIPEQLRHRTWTKIRELRELDPSLWSTLAVDLITKLVAIDPGVLDDEIFPGNPTWDLLVFHHGEDGAVSRNPEQGLIGWTAGDDGRIAVRTLLASKREFHADIDMLDECLRWAAWAIASNRADLWWPMLLPDYAYQVVSAHLDQRAAKNRRQRITAMAAIPPSDG